MDFSENSKLLEIRSGGTIIDSLVLYKGKRDSRIVLPPVRLKKQVEDYWIFPTKKSLCFYRHLIREEDKNSSRSFHLRAEGGCRYTIFVREVNFFSFFSPKQNILFPNMTGKSKTQISKNLAGVFLNNLLNLPPIPGKELKRFGDMLYSYGLSFEL